MENPTPQQIADYLKSHGLLAVPQQQAVQVGAPQPYMPRMPAIRGGGGGANFTGVTAGTYAFGTGSIVVNSKGQVVSVTADAGASVQVDENGTPVVAAATILDFISQFIVTDAGSGRAEIRSTFVPLDLVYDSSSTTAAPYVFGSWTEVAAAIAAIPVADSSGNSTPYRLYIADPPDAGTHDLNGCRLEGFAPEFGSTAFRTTIATFGGYVIDNCAHFKNLRFSATGLGLSSTVFSQGIGSALATEIDNVGLTQPEVPTVSFFLLFGGRMIIRDSDLGSASIDFTLDARVDCYGATSIAASALTDFTTSGATAGINIWDTEVEVSLSQTVTLDLNLGGNTGGFTEVIPHGGGANFEFSCGLTDFASIASPGPSAELYAGAAYAGPAATYATSAAPQTPAFSAPFRGFVCPRNCYIRGIGVQIPTVGGADAFTIEVYVAGGLVLTESFVSGTVLQFADTTFGEVTQGDSIEVLITPGGTETAVLPEGLIVSIRAS